MNHYADEADVQLVSYPVRGMGNFGLNWPSWNDVKQYFVDQTVAEFTGTDLTAQQLPNDPVTSSFRNLLDQLLKVSPTPDDLIKNINAAVQSGQLPQDQALALLKAQRDLVESQAKNSWGGQAKALGEGALSAVEALLLLGAVGGGLYLAWPAIGGYVGARAAGRSK